LHAHTTRCKSLSNTSTTFARAFPSARAAYLDKRTHGENSVAAKKQFSANKREHAINRKANITGWMAPFRIVAAELSTTLGTPCQLSNVPEQQLVDASGCTPWPLF